MFARVTTLYVKPETIDEAIRIYEDSVVPAARAQKGFHSATLLVDRKAAKGLSVTYWENEADALANEENKYYQEQLVKIMGFFSAPPIREGFEVTVEAC